MTRVFFLTYTSYMYAIRCRVHQFTKVEMFSVCLPDQSDRLLEMYLDIQEELFSAYDLHYRIIDMAPHELGRQAYRKYDVEAWMPGLNRYGEISSCSNCTDYQVQIFAYTASVLCIRVHDETFLSIFAG